MLGVNGLALDGVEAGRVGVDVGHLKGLDHVRGAEDVLVPGQGPAQQGQVVDQPLGEHAAVAVDEQVGLRVALGQLPVALPHDVGQVAEPRHRAGAADLRQRPVQGDLARRGGQQVLPAQHVGDPHGGVVHGVDQRVEGVPACPHDDVVGDRAGPEGDGPAHQVGEGDVLIRHAHAQDGAAALGPVGGLLGLGQVPVVAVVAELGVLAPGPVTGLDLLGGGEGLVQVPGLEQLGGDLPVEIHALGLAVGLVGAADAHALVPVQAQPGQGVDNGLKGLLGVAGGVGVLDTEDEGAPGVAGPGPVEQAGTHHTHVGGAGWRGAEAHAHGRGPGCREGRAGRGVGAGDGGVVRSVRHDGPSVAPGTACTIASRRGSAYHGLP